MPPKFVYTALIVLLNLPIARGQGSVTDTSELPKYSYLIYGYSSSGNAVQATGFFVNKKKRTYLVTACHVINGWLFESFNERASYPDTLYVKIGLKNSQQDTSLAIDIRSLKYTKADPYSHDIYFIPIHIPSNCVINSLESLISNFSPIDKIPQTIFAYGFIADEQNLSSRQFRELAPKAATARLPDWNAYACSPLVYEIAYSGNDLGAGDSGAPVYFITRNFGSNRNSVRLQFGGLLFGGNTAKHRAMVVRPELVKALYDEL